MKEEYNKLINDGNKNRNNIYYQLNQLTAITGLSPRMLKYKMLKVKEKYAGVTKLLKKEGKRWFIHPSIIVEFLPVNNRKNNIDNYSNWSSFVTWNPFKNYDADYHIELIKEIKSELPNSTIKYTIELDKRGFNHVHFISDASTIKTKEIVEKVILKYFSWFEVSYQVTEINNKFTSNEYLQKSPVRNGILN
jgi:NAD-specific glutamate dehydrogenase